jgi:hypothetical protein
MGRSLSVHCLPSSRTPTVGYTSKLTTLAQVSVPPGATHSVDHGAIVDGEGWQDLLGPRSAASQLGLVWTRDGSRVGAG